MTVDEKFYSLEVKGDYVLLLIYSTVEWNYQRLLFAG